MFAFVDIRTLAKIKQKVTRRARYICCFERHSRRRICNLIKARIVLVSRDAVRHSAAPSGSDVTARVMWRTRSIDMGSTLF